MSEELQSEMDPKNFQQVVVDELLPCPVCKSDECVIVVSDKGETSWFAFCIEEGCEEGPTVYSLESADDCADKWNEKIMSGSSFVFYCQADTEGSAIKQAETQYGADAKIKDVQKDSRPEMAQYEDRWEVQVTVESK